MILDIGIICVVIYFLVLKGVDRYKERYIYKGGLTTVHIREALKNTYLTSKF